MNKSLRITDYPINKQFIQRWSPRAFTDQQISENELFTFLEAARWAPSSYNSQPWRFLFARRGTSSWPIFLELLNNSNQEWAQKAAALLIVISKKTFIHPSTHKEMDNPSHAFDTGAAWAYFALQASLSGWHTHGMAGFDKNKARANFHIPERFSIEAAIAIGKIGNKADLPKHLQAMETPSGRHAVSQWTMEGEFTDHNA